VNKPRDIILRGGTGQARVLGEFLPVLGWRVAAVFDNDPAVTPPLAGVPLYHGETALRAWLAARPGPVDALVAVGGDRGTDRLRLQEELAAAGCRFPVVAHPSAHVAAGVDCGAGTQILARSLVGVGSRIGRAVIVNSSASVDHECVLEDGVHVGPGAVLCGLVTVGRAAFVGAGAVVLPRVVIGAGTAVGAGAVVTRDLPDNVVAWGNPARIIRHRSASDA
jgi:sugar O-acyltransferase (sialic acid O-acetyltransferase NeuD family)